MITQARIFLLLGGVAVVSGLIWSLMTIGELKAEARQSEQAIISLSQTIREERARYEQTDRMLAETARQREDASRRANELADQLRALSGADPCLDARISPNTAERVRQYRTSPPLSEGAGAAGVD
jgi:septal ring factor EnvC (AmiA/AmiB activator)